MTTDTTMYERLAVIRYLGERLTESARTIPGAPFSYVDSMKMLAHRIGEVVDEYCVLDSAREAARKAGQ